MDLNHYLFYNCLLKKVFKKVLIKGILCVGIPLSSIQVIEVRPHHTSLHLSLQWRACFCRSPDLLALLVPVAAGGEDADGAHAAAWQAHDDVDRGGDPEGKVVQARVAVVVCCWVVAVSVCGAVDEDAAWWRRGERGVRERRIKGNTVFAKILN